jgi:hypothetical protein
MRDDIPELIEVVTSLLIEVKETQKEIKELQDKIFNLEFQGTRN